MEKKTPDYQFQKKPQEKQIMIAARSPISLKVVLDALDQMEPSALSEELAAARRELTAQWNDPALRETSMSGRDVRLPHFVLSQDELAQMSRIPKETWGRFIRYRYRFKVYPSQQRVGDFPIVVCVEPTSICNLRCQMCFQSDSSFSSDKSFLGRMDPGLFRQIIDEMVAHGCDSLVLASRGEPTLHPQFAEMLSYATAGILDVKINTNATRLSEALCHRILEAAPNVVVFSIDSAEPAQYEEIRKGATFSDVLMQVKRFHEIRERHYPKARTVTRVSATLFRPDQDTERIRRFWSEIADEVALHTAWPFWDSYHAPISDIVQPCALLWERVYIWWDGVVNPCDIDYKSMLALGKMPEQSLQEIWLGDNAQGARRLHQQRLKNTLTPCNRCSGTC